MLRAYVVDDEALALRNLIQMLENAGGVNVVGHSTDPEQALQDLSALPVDLLFLDIHMPGLNGFGLLARLAKPPAVVFTTAWDEYAVEAFRANAIDYVLKPVSKDDLARALEKAGRWVGNAAVMAKVETVIANLQTAAKYPARITSRVGGRIHVIDLSRVSYFVSEGNLTYAVAPDGRYSVDISLNDLERKLDPTSFFRIHRATIVNLSWVEEMHAWFGGRLLIRLKGGAELKVARERARSLKDSLGL